MVVGQVAGRQLPGPGSRWGVWVGHVCTLSCGPMVASEPSTFL